MCMEEEIVKDKLFNKLIELIKEFTEKVPTVNAIMEIKRIMYKLMKKYKYINKDECRELHNRLSIEIKTITTII